MARDDDREIVYVEREGGSIRPLLLGILLGTGLGLLFAPQSGEETRRQLNRRLRRVRALAEEKVGELSEKIGDTARRVTRDDDLDEDEEDEFEPVRAPSVRDDLERRLAEARARRRAAVKVDDGEQHA
jgi:gas vesicle protein